MHHELKTTKPYFGDTLRGDKLFELRKNDRGFKKGDTVTLREWDQEKEEYTGRDISLTIQYILEDYPGLEEGYCIFGV